MIPILFICSGFILAILWVDVKFDWLAVPYRNKPGILTEEVLAPMAYFYHYATTKPILIATAALLITITLVSELIQASVPAWTAWVSLVLVGITFFRAGTLVVPTARRFGKRSDSLEKQTSTAHALLALHLSLFVLLFIMTVIQFYATMPIMKISMALFFSIGYITAIAWLNLKFDLIAVSYRGKPGTLPEEVIAPIALFHRYLKSAVGMGVAMIVILTTHIVEILQGSIPGWLAWTSLILFIAGMSVPITIIRSGRRLGIRTDSLEKQTSLVHGMFLGHLAGQVIILLVAVLQVFALWNL